MANRVDILINGGGIVGFTLLNLIRRSPSLCKLNVALLEQGKSLDEAYELEKPAGTRVFSNRVSSISASSKDSLESIGIWNEILPFAKRVHKIKVWNYNYSKSINFESEKSRKYPSSFNDPAFTVIENNRLSSALLGKLKLNNDNSIYWNTRLKSLTHSFDNNLIEAKALNDENNEISFKAPFIIGCDGFKSTVRNLASFNYRECNLDKNAVVGTIRMAPDNNFHLESNDIAYQRFSELYDAVVAILPLSDDYSSFVISAPTEYSNYLMKMTNEAFVNEFNNLLHSSTQPTNGISRILHQYLNLGLNQLSSFLPTSFEYMKEGKQHNYPPEIDAVVDKSRACFPLYFGTTSPYMVSKFANNDHNQIALLGDSTHRVHPLAGQGLNLGMSDASELVTQLENVTKSGGFLFHDHDNSSLDEALRRYQFNRQKSLIAMQATILAMPTVFNHVPEEIVSKLDGCNILKSIAVKVANNS